MTSTHNPLASGKSLFVRLSNFTHQSFNAGNGNRSKIIFHLPRFDNTGREEGEGLYFESEATSCGEVCFWGVGVGFWAWN